jgi:hypothetical protein
VLVAVVVVGLVVVVVVVVVAVVAVGTAVGVVVVVATVVEGISGESPANAPAIEFERHVITSSVFYYFVQRYIMAHETLRASDANAHRLRAFFQTRN